MTVPNEIPVIYYTGNGSTVSYYWFWKMLPESAIDVYVDNVDVDGWSVSGNFVIFDVAPDVGQEIIIFRRTPLHQPENYAFARGFKANKTELTLDREYMICQEYESGIVGGNDLHTRKQIDGIWVQSERGEDAFVPLWEGEGGDIPPPLPPNESGIIWAGDVLDLSRTGNENISVQLKFLAAAGGGTFGQANASYTDDQTTRWVGWLDNPTITGDFLVRVLNVIGGSGNFTIKDGNNLVKSIGDEFEAVDATVTLDNSGFPSPVFPSYTMDVDISDVTIGQWIRRSVTMELVAFVDTNDIGMMGYSNVNSLYSTPDKFSTVGSGITIVGSFNIPSFDGNGLYRILELENREFGNNTLIAEVFFAPIDYEFDTVMRGKMIVELRGENGLRFCRVVSQETVIDGQDHVLFFSYDSDSSDMTFIIDGVAADNTGWSGRVKGVGPFDTYDFMRLVLGAGDIDNFNIFDTKLGYFGYNQTYMTNWFDFMLGNQPKELDEITWTEWGGIQPYYWNKSGEMDVNLGTRDDMFRQQITGPTF